MRRFNTFLIIALVFALTISCRGQNECLQLDIMLVADLSGSVYGKEAFIVEAFTSFVNQFELGQETVKIGAIYFNTTASMLSPLTSDKRMLVHRLQSLTQASGNTNMAEGLYLAIRELSGENSRQGYKKIVIIVSDGIVDNSHLVLQISRQMRSIGVIVCGILIDESQSDDRFMIKVSSDGHYVRSNYKTLVDQIKRLDICL